MEHSSVDQTISGQDITQPREDNDLQIPDASIPEKRRPGRPRGSKNKKRSSKEGSEDASEPVSRPRGRPRGTGHLQREEAARIAAGEPEPPPRASSRPVGRPRNHPSGQPVQIRIRAPGERIHVPGIPDPTRQRHLAEAAALIQKTNLADVSAPSTLTTPLTSVQNSDAQPASNSSERILSEAEADAEVSADNNYEALLNDGIGSDEDGGDDEADEDGVADEEDPAASDLPDGGGNKSLPKPRRTARPLPTWLRNQFNAKVKESGIRLKDGLPPLYRDHQCFWFPETDPLFSMRNFDQDFGPQQLYRAPFFLWDPQALLPHGIPCPQCGRGLHRHGHIPRPRRCVDLDRTFYIIGYRYRCSHCINPQSRLKTVTFRSWDSRIIAKLPRSLSSRFPARLTYRSGLSQSLFMFMRTCFQSGMGAKQFADALRVRHLEKYDELQIAYLSTLAERLQMAEFTEHHRRFKSFLPFEDVSSDGFHGFVPSSQWLRDLFDKFVEDHAHQYEQHTALLPLQIGQIDHSFKLAKHIAKINGEQIFTALLTVTNERGEIRICNLVATKSHSQFELALNRLRDSLQIYGHDQPALFYTDNMSDKDFLERCFPSLREDVVAVEKYPHLEPLEIPSTVKIQVLDTVPTINAAIESILHDLPADNSTQNLVIFVDSEWNVETSAQGYVTGRGQTAIFQIAYKNYIYILQIGKMLAGNRLPQALIKLLTNPRVLKVGRAVGADLKYLQDTIASTATFVGGVDLAKLAKDRLLVPSAQVSLADLCATILECRLNKNVAERISSAWDREQLSEDQRRYAALDVYACLCIYDALIVIPIPSPLPKSPSMNTPILLFNSDQGRVIARGTIAGLEGSYDQVSITKTRCLVEISEVLVPAAVITSHRRQPLSVFGPPPFKIVCTRSHVRLGTSFAQPTACSQRRPEPPRTGSESDSLHGPDEEVEPSDFGDLILKEFSSSTAQSAAAIQGCARDPQSADEGARVLDQRKPEEWSVVIFSRTLKDPFHVFNMFYISVVHGLRVEFARALRDAMFIPDAEDKARIVAWGLRQIPQRSWEGMVAKSSDWVWRRCKRVIPPPQQLHHDVSEVFRVFGPLKDATTGLPLFNTAAWAVAKNILDLIYRGFVSDPPGIPLYFKIGVDAKTGLPIYRCMRGTNNTEGGVHTHLRSRMPTSGAGIRHANACLKEFILRHNLLVGTFNSTGKRYSRHYSIWLINELQELLYFVQDMLVSPQLITGWVNGNLYQQTIETSGVLPIPEDVRLRYGMAVFEPSLDFKKYRHRYLAALQCTRKAVLPLSNDEEEHLFWKLMAECFDLKSTAGLERAVKLWNAYADTNDKISYKLPEQLKAYFNGKWKTNMNAKQTKSMTLNERAPVMAQLSEPTRLSSAPKVPETVMKPHRVPAGLLALEDVPSAEPTVAATSQCPPEPSPIVLSAGLGSNAGIAASTLVFTAGSSCSSATPVQLTLAPPQEMLIQQLSRKRAADSLPQNPIANKRARRTCRKCAIQYCNGSRNVDLCQNKCRDCGKSGSDKSCVGRNPKYPSVMCTKARWP